MTLEDVYYIGQTIAVFAIIGSLAYVAIQTRQNGRTMRAKAIWDAQVSFVEINDMLASGGKISELSYKWAADPESLTGYEKYLIHRLMRGVLQRTEAQYALYTNGILDAEVWQLRRGYIKSLMNNPALVEIWNADKANSMFTLAFIAEIENAPARGDAIFMGTPSQTEKQDGA